MGSDPPPAVQNYHPRWAHADFLSESSRTKTVKTVIIILGAVILAFQAQTSWQNQWDNHTLNNDKSKDTLVITEVGLATLAYETLIKENQDLQSFQVQTFLWSQQEFSIQKNPARYGRDP